MKVNSKSRKVLAFALILLAVVYGAYLFFRGTDIKMTSLFPVAPGERLLMSMEGFRFIQTVNGNSAWRMNAGSADLYESKEAYLKDIEIVYTSADKVKKQATLLGENGTMDTSTGDASIRRGAREVRIATSDGYLLTTDSLSWKAGERLIWTPDPFKLLGKEIYLEGRGVTADVDMRTIVVKKNVKAILQE